jgi:hypothetical protein
MIESLNEFEGRLSLVRSHQPQHRSLIHARRSSTTRKGSDERGRIRFNRLICSQQAADGQLHHTSYVVRVETYILYSHLWKPQLIPQTLSRCRVPRDMRGWDCIIMMIVDSYDTFMQYFFLMTVDGRAHDSLIHRPNSGSRRVTTIHNHHHRISRPHLWKKKCEQHPKGLVHKLYQRMHSPVYALWTTYEKSKKKIQEKFNMIYAWQFANRLTYCLFQKILAFVIWKSNIPIQEITLKLHLEYLWKFQLQSSTYWQWFFFLQNSFESRNKVGLLWNVSDYSGKNKGICIVWFSLKRKQRDCKENQNLRFVTKLVEKGYEPSYYFYPWFKGICKH